MLGVFNLVMSVYIFGITLGNFGINFAITRLVSEELAIGNMSGAKKIAKICILSSLLCGIFSSTIFLLFSDFIINNCLHKKISKSVIYLICLALPFISMSTSITGYFVAVRRVYKSTFSQFFEQIIKIILSAFCLSLFLPNGLDYACFALILGDLLSEISSFVFNYILYLKDSKIYNQSYKINMPLKYYNKKVFHLSLPVAITSMIKSGLSTIKQIIIPLSFEKGLMDCKKALSLYGEINGMAMPIILFPNVIFSSISSLLVPEFASYKAQNRHKSIKYVSWTVILISIILCILASILLFLLSNKLGLWIYKDQTISNYIKILSPLAFFVLLDCVIDNILKGLDAQNSVMIINICDTFIDIILIYFIVPKFGIHGYIISIYVSEIFNLILSSIKMISTIKKF